MKMEVVDLSPNQPTLTVTPAFARRFENEYRWMLREEAKPPGKRDPMQAVRVYAVASVLADLLRASGVQGVPDGEPGSVLVALRDLLGMRDGQSFADPEPELVHAGPPAGLGAETLCGLPLSEDTIFTVESLRGHVTCRACREAAEL